MKCTLISGPQGSGKSQLARWIAKPYAQHTVQVYEGASIQPYDPDSKNFFELSLSPDCSLIIVEGIEDQLTLKEWLLLARWDSLLSGWPRKSPKTIRPEFLLLFKYAQPVREILPFKDTRNFKIIDLSCQPHTKM